MIKTKMNVDGILLLNKGLGLSSNAALQKVKRLFSAKKAGHTGSLDPLATGMLPICFGEATKFSQFLLESDKHYLVTIQFGVKTTTGDKEGEVIAVKPVQPLSHECLNPILMRYTGTIQQIPPMFSAIKHQGKPLYELARAGIEVKREPRTVHIYQLNCIQLGNDSCILDVQCSKGTYIRTLAEDIGDALGCGAHVIELKRVAVLPYQNTPMYTLDNLEEIQRRGNGELAQLLLPVESSLLGLPAVNLTSATAFYLRAGQSITVPHLPASGLVRLYLNNKLLGVGEITANGKLAPKRLISA